MVKSVLGVAHQGVRDWVIQRVSAIYMLLYLLLVPGYFCLVGDAGFEQWSAFFKLSYIRIATVFFLASVLSHAWIGMWTIFTDYVKNAWLRALLHSLVFFALSGYFIWGLIILWSV